MSADSQPQREADSAGARMPFLEHLDELRRRLTWIAFGILAGVVVCYAFSNEILNFLLEPIRQQMGQLAVIRPAEAFLNRIKAAFVGGIFLSAPWIIYQLWAFIAPGLYPRERRWVVPVVVVGSVLFLAGAAFCYAVALPAAVGFLASQAESFDSNVTVDHAFRFCTKLLLGLGVTFELPLVMFALARLRLIRARRLARRLDLAVFVCFLAAAILTPTPDILTMSIFALPMIALYLVGLGVAWIAEPRSQQDPADD